MAVSRSQPSQGQKLGVRLKISSIHSRGVSRDIRKLCCRGNDRSEESSCICEVIIELRVVTAYPRGGTNLIVILNLSIGQCPVVNPEFVEDPNERGRCGGTTLPVSPERHV